MDMEFFEKRFEDMDMDTAWNRCPPNSVANPNRDYQNFYLL